MNLHQPKPHDESKLIGIAVSNDADPHTALADIANQLSRAEMGVVLLFLPDGVDSAQTAAAIDAHLSAFVVYGASSAGQITPKGYEDTAWLAIGLTKAHFHVASVLITPLNPFSIEKIASIAQATSRRFVRTADWNRLGILITDGLSKQEDVLIATLAASLPEFPIFGGSAAENSREKKTLVYTDGRFHQNAALLLLLDTDLGFSMVNFDHFVPIDRKMVVTKALPDERIVQELNGMPAAREYARIIGVDETELSQELFAQYPVLIKEGPRYHVRSIQKIGEDSSLSLLCSIDVGLILTLGSGKEIVRTLEKELGQTRIEGREPEFILGFDCFLRRLEIEQRQRVERASRVLVNHKVVGFNTFGEQHSGMHVNQTFVGIAFYKSERRKFGD